MGIANRFRRPSPEQVQLGAGIGKMSAGIGEGLKAWVPWPAQIWTCARRRGYSELLGAKPDKRW